MFSHIRTFAHAYKGKGKWIYFITVEQQQKMPTNKGKRVHLTLQQKVEVIQKANGRSNRVLAKVFGVGRTQVITYYDIQINTHFCD